MFTFLVKCKIYVSDGPEAEATIWWPHKKKTKKGLQHSVTNNGNQNQQGATALDEDNNERDNSVVLPLRNRRRPFEQTFKGRLFPPNIQKFVIGRMDQECIHCEALTFPGKKLNCCHSGKVDMPPVTQYPEQLRGLLTANDATSRHFLDNIRKYNSSVAFSERKRKPQMNQIFSACFLLALSL